VWNTLLGFHKVNTTAYHPQTDGLVERFNRTLTAMLAKTVAEDGGQDWDEHLPYVLFAYRASQQDSTQESPFFLVYGRDPRLPTPAALCPEQVRRNVDLREYGVELATRMSTAWETARKCVQKAQKRQKQHYNTKARQPKFAVGDRVFLLRPEEKTGATRKLTRPFHGPYRVMTVTASNAHVRRVDQPQGETIFVALERLRRCPKEVADEFWPAKKPRKRGRPKKNLSTSSSGDDTSSTELPSAAPPAVEALDDHDHEQDAPQHQDRQIRENILDG